MDIPTAILTGFALVGLGLFYGLFNIGDGLEEIGSGLKAIAEALNKERA